MAKTTFLSVPKSNSKCTLCEYSNHCPLRNSSNRQTSYIGARVVRCKKDQEECIKESLKRRLP